DASLQIIFKEFSELYEACCAGKDSALPEPGLHGSDFGAWQREQAAGQGWAEHVDFWRNELKGAPALLELPADHARPAKQSYKAASVTRALPEELAAQIKEAGQRHGFSEFSVAASALGILLHRYSGQPDIIIGTPVGILPDRGNTVGNFENLVLLRGRIRSDLSFGEAFENAGKGIEAALRHRE